MKTLHVLNGDATLHGFRQSGLPGDVAVWREMLSEGPVKADVHSDEELWAIRRNWIQEEFGDQLPAEETYADKVVQEFTRICQYADYDEVVFWFEHDLFCQINLVFLLACFALVDLGPVRLKQVSIDRHPEVPDFKGLGQLTGEQLSALYPKAEELTPHELNVAAQVWQAYAGPEPERLVTLLNADFGRLRFLKAALLNHLRRFPARQTGLNAIERQLTALRERESLSEPELVGRFLQLDQVYGIGDWSVAQYLRQMGTGLRPTSRWVGGYEIRPDTRLRWAEEQQNLVEV
ncbi:hypothetical protein GCM10023189_40910 [Nibrella saemangeumensis]|uniref:DUF1835 domain-containing protein n=1 Tax=Nibrella saemangeumensis TaxID=1084526 RepID=A0ABP8NBP3_9BACT